MDLNQKDENKNMVMSDRDDDDKRTSGGLKFRKKLLYAPKFEHVLPLS